MQCRGGDLSCFEEIEMTEAEKQWKNERAGGNYGAGTKEIQARNYIAQKELERKRKELFEDALVDFRAGKVEDALQVFEEVKALEPAKYIGDSFERVSRILVVTLYNIACCYSALKATDAGLEALEECMRSGFDDYDKVGPHSRCTSLQALRPNTALQCGSST
jgi:tetratricopeptide (TPR) repeat protein